ncbi:PREDICTED: caspase-1-like [Nicrophorus vespilloides]|uniref:Caspase-1-like n=1 Tax=Nicrophorus vespilloides TaxID=110193 RepID=A0ABM1MMN6_NICVS|nr:PREDICTED: caspase-1-like [Nicrophorus vespilloides]
MEKTDVDGFGWKFPFFSKNKEDEKDARGSSTAKIPCQVIPTVVAADSDFYDMTHARRGKALIFNHYQFNDSSLQKREGTNRDCENITKTLSKLNFEVTVCQDFTYGQIYDTIHNVAGEDHSDADCLMIVVMSHGDKGVIHARDSEYTPDELWLPFSGDKCPSLAGKPKLVFIQACRGEELDAGVSVFAAPVMKDSAQKTYKLPAMADFLIMYSTTEGHYSFRSPNNGSWMIQCLCAELLQRSAVNDLMTILTFVNRRMAIDFQSNVPSNRNFDKMKQIGSVVSSLTRILYFQ